MKKQLIFSLSLLALVDVSGCREKEVPVERNPTVVPDSITCVQVDPLVKIFKEDETFPETSDSAHVAKGETASFQFVLRSENPISNLQVAAGDLVNGNRRIPSSLKAFTGYHQVGMYAPTPSRDVLRPASGFFPDYLQETESLEVDALSNQPVWINYDIPRDAAAGIYQAEVTFSGSMQGKSFSITKQLSTKVYNVTVPEQTMWVTHWIQTKDYQLRQLNNDSQVTPFSELYWALLKLLANKARDLGQNTFVISPLDLTQFTISGNTYTFDFSRFDQHVEFYIREGGLRRLEGDVLGERDGNTILMKLPVGGGGLAKYEFSDSRIQNFLAQFMPALYNHIKSKGWEDIYIQHLADEPGKGGQTTAYKQIAAFIKDKVPQIKFVEAIDPWSDIEGMGILDVYVAQLGVCHTNYAFLKTHQASGKEVWMYTCMYPQGNYANRFFELPLIQTRILSWINYKYGITGYLHWALNAWPDWYDNWKNHAAIPLGTAGGCLPAGDSWIVYPAYRKVYSTVRYEAMRDGIKDYDLLKLLEKKNPARAQEIVNSVVFYFDNYNSSVEAFRATRIKMLTWLSE
jgi:hypothetical protein